VSAVIDAPGKPAIMHDTSVLLVADGFRSCCQWPLPSLDLGSLVVIVPDVAICRRGKPRLWHVVLVGAPFAGALECRSNVAIHRSEVHLRRPR